MLFHSFKTQEERRAFGGSAFIELQHCRVKPETPLSVILSTADFWKTDSLYVYLDDSEIFYEAYASVFGNGIYQNEKEGPLDVCGLNYYPADRKKAMIEALQEKKPIDCERLTEWLTSGESSFGFYLLGL